MKTIYVDTSVFGGIFDIEFKLWSELFFENVFNSDIQLILSNVAKDELKNAPSKIKEFVNNIPISNLQEVELNEEAILLAEQYLFEKVVGETSRADCYHIAIATLLKVDLLVSWNFKHIVNINRIHGYNAVNLKNGFKQ